jgi:DNA-binding transcriptional LysR family regulator
MTPAASGTFFNGTAPLDRRLRKESPLDRWYAMKVFVRVVESGSFVKAASKLDLSTTATSRLVAELESHLGTRLLQRTTRRLHLTESGQRFFERSRELLTGLEEAEAEASEGTERPSGVLRVTIPASFGTLHLAQLLPMYQERYPEVALEVLAIDRMVDLVNDGFDLAIRLATQHDPSYVARKLATIRLAVCASDSYLVRHGAPREPLELAQHNCLTHAFGTYTDKWTFRGQRGAVTVPVKGNFRTNNGELLRAAALAGEGIILEPTFLIGNDLAKGDLVPLLQDWEVPHATAVALYPSRRFVSAKVRTFVDFMHEAFANEPSWDRWMR